MEKIIIENITADEPKIKKKGKISYKVIPIKYNEGQLPSGAAPLDLRLNGRMKIYAHSDNNFSLSYTITDEKILNMSGDIEKQINKVISKQNLHPINLKLVKTDASELPKIYSKLYTDQNGKINCPFSMIVNGRNKTKFNPHEIISVPFDGTVILRINQVFLGNIKSIICVAKEVLIDNIIKPKSFFDDYDDVEGAEED